jgi:hypothetical protein
LTDHVDRRRADGRAVKTVYTNWVPPLVLWSELKVASYFSLPQVVGVMFNRDTAREAIRRANLAAPFEIVRRDTPGARSTVAHLMYSRMFFGTVPAGPSAVAAICADPALDVAAVTSVRDDRRLAPADVEIIDCDLIRSGASATPPSPEHAAK